MSITETVVLPAQPGTGTAVYVGLGGNGYSSPFAAYAVHDFEQTGDAGAGSVTFKITMDVRYVSLVSYVTWNGNQVASADADYRLSVGSSPGAPNWLENGVAVAIAAGVSSNTIGKTFQPTPALLPGNQDAHINVKVKNVLNDVHKVSALIYLFRHDVRQVAPIGPLLWARGL